MLQRCGPPLPATDGCRVTERLQVSDGRREAAQEETYGLGSPGSSSSSVPSRRLCPIVLCRPRFPPSCLSLTTRALQKSHACPPLFPQTAPWTLQIAIGHHRIPLGRETQPRHISPSSLLENPIRAAMRRPGRREQSITTGRWMRLLGLSPPAVATNCTRSSTLLCCLVRIRYAAYFVRVPLPAVHYPSTPLQ